MLAGEPLRRGRPPNLLRRHAICNVALRSFVSLGYGGATMRLIATDAGLSEPLLYRYYETKAHLLSGVASFVIEAGVATNGSLQRYANSHSSLREFLTAVGRVCSDHTDELDSWDVAGLLELPLARTQRTAIAAQLEKTFQMVANGLATRGSFHDPYVAARSFLASLSYNQKLDRAGLEHPTEQLREVFLRELVELIAHGATTGDHFSLGRSARKDRASARSDEIA